jgi:hypothetical protein
MVVSTSSTKIGKIINIIYYKSNILNYGVNYRHTMYLLNIEAQI